PGRVKRPEARELEVRAHGAGAGGRDDGVVLDVVNLEAGRVPVAQHHVGRAILVEVGKTRDLKVEPDRADVERRRDLIVGDVVELELAISSFRLSSKRSRFAATGLR